MRTASGSSPSAHRGACWCRRVNRSPGCGPAEVNEMQGAGITGWGMALPPRIVTNDDIGTILPTSDDWIRERTGIQSRHVATGPFVPDDPEAPESPPGGLGTTAVLAVEAAPPALASA